MIGANLDVDGLTARAATAIHEGGIKLLGLHQLTRNTDLQTIVAEEDYDQTVKVLHKALVETGDVAGAKSDADIAAAA